MIKMTEKRTNIMVVDDQDGMRRSLAILLRRAGYHVTEAENGDSAISHLQQTSFDVVITDLKMSPGTGMDVLYYIKEKHPLTEVIIMTGYGTINSAVLAMKMKAYDYIAKPFREEELIHRVNKAVSHLQAKRDMAELHPKMRGNGKYTYIKGESQTMKDLLALCDKIARVDLPVLITGETGTGKNLVAKAIHGLSSRSDRPLVSINCAAVPEHLFESELFGHSKGAFTGALLDRKGLFEEAEGGSLLLDEIGSMPFTMQAKLLDVLQERVIRQVGSNKTKKVNVRIMAATNSDLLQAIRDVNFREDLYYRINVTHIHVPSLREHREDIPVLAQHFLDVCKQEFLRPDLAFSPEAIDLLSSYDYPGNIRELSNIISSIVAVTSSHAPIKAEDLALGFTNRLFDVSTVPNTENPPATLDEWEKDLIIRSIKKNDQNLSKVCAELGIGRTTLWRKMKKYNIE
jgi:DNA-binding NtrC family response regulator